MATFLETLLADVEHIAEADMPSASDVRGVVAALVKRVEQLTGIDSTAAPIPLPGADPSPDAPPTATGPLPPAGSASDLTILTQLQDFQKGTITEGQLGANAAKALADAGGNVAAAIAARQAAHPAPDAPAPGVRSGSASDLTILTQLQDLQKGVITESQLGPNAAKALAAAGGNVAAAIAARPHVDSPPAAPSGDTAQILQAITSLGQQVATLTTDVDTLKAAAPSAGAPA